MRPAQQPQHQLESTHARGGVRSLIGRRRRQGISLRRRQGPPALSMNSVPCSRRMRDRALAVLILLGCSLLAIGQSAAPPSVEKPSRGAGSPVAGAPSAGGSPVAADRELKLVVALFRHGVRAPLDGFTDESANAHSKNTWPRLAAWKVMKDEHGEPGDWGDLTVQGQKLVTALGDYYAKYYKSPEAWPNGFKAFLWADAEDQRTRETAKALADGLRKPDINVTVDFLQPTGKVDLLFHPFKAECGTPNPPDLESIAYHIKSNWWLWAERYKNRFSQFYGVLGCGSAASCNFTTPD